MTISEIKNYVLYQTILDYKNNGGSDRVALSEIEHAIGQLTDALDEATKIRDEINDKLRKT